MSLWQKNPRESAKSVSSVFYNNPEGTTINSIIKYISFILLLLGLISCSQEKDQENLLARVNDHDIYLEDFRTFYAFDPNFGKDSTGLESLQDQLDLYIDRFLAMKKADSDKLWENPIYSRGYKWEKRQAMLRQLYRVMVEKSVTVTEEETRREFHNLNIEVNIRHLFTKNESEAEDLYAQLKLGETFETLASRVFQDSILSKNGGDLGWLKLSEFEDNLIDAIKILQVGQISRPVSSRWGYHIIEVLNRRENPIMVEEDYFREQEKMYKRVRMKKNKKAANRYISKTIGELNPQLNDHGFRLILYAAVPSAEREKNTYTNKILLSDGIISAIEQELKEDINKELITYREGNVSLKQFLDAMKEIPLGHRPKFNSARQFSNQIGIWIRDELLIEKATSQGFDDDDQVLKEIYEFKAEQSYYYYHYQLKDELETPPKIIKYFDTANENRIKNQNRQLSHFHNLEEWRWWRVQKDLHQMLRAENPDIWINDELLKQENLHIDWNNQIRMFMVRNPS